MPKYKWEMTITVEADDDIEAQARVEEALEEALTDPDGLFSYGEMIKKKAKRQKTCRWCRGKFDPEASEHKNLCSDKCFHEEQACQ